MNSGRTVVVAAFQERTNVVLKMTSREVDGTSVVALHGRIVLGDERSALRDKLKNLISEGKKKIVLNMDHIEHIDGSGLGMLVAAHLSANTHGASLKLCHLGGKFQEVLQLTRLVTVFHVSTTEAIAIASFSKPPDEAAPQKPSDSTPNRPREY
jgi:anti-sigma B factor antagonist